MIEKTICEKCGAEMHYFHREGSHGWECSNCGHGWATTYYDDLEFDETLYSTLIHPMEKPAIQAIKTVSVIMRCNYIESQRLLKKGFLINDQSAINTRDIAKQLKDGQIIFSISPDFPHSI